MRRTPLVNNSYYHIYTKSVDDITLFRCSRDFDRMRLLLRFFSYYGMNIKFSRIKKLEIASRKGVDDIINQFRKQATERVRILSYCFMPNHIHLLIRQTSECGISGFMKDILNSYTRYYNTKYKRKGPLWVGRFKSVFVDSEEQFLHLLRYIHLNPVTSGLVTDVSKWKYSSYSEYIDEIEPNRKVCLLTDEIQIYPEQFKIFIKDRAQYQKELAKIKKTVKSYTYEV